MQQGARETGRPFRIRRRTEGKRRRYCHRECRAGRMSLAQFIELTHRGEKIRVNIGYIVAYRRRPGEASTDILLAHRSETFPHEIHVEESPEYIDAAIKTLQRGRLIN